MRPYTILEDRHLANKVEFMVSCISDFARAFSIKQHEAYSYMSQYMGIDYLLRHYEALHTLSIDEAVEDVKRVCIKNGGGLGR